MTYQTTIRIWSRNGHTPITNRTGNYCDELLSTTVTCVDPEEAQHLASELKKTTPGAYSCHYVMPDYPNQNTRSGFCHYG